MEYSIRVKIASHSFGFGLAENHVRSRGLYLEEFEPVQILTTIDGR